MAVLTCPPESLETGEIANDMTGSGTFIEVMVYLTDPSVKVSPDDKKKFRYHEIYIYETNEAKSNISKIGMKHHKTSCNSLIATILG